MEPRVKLSVPREETFLVPPKYIDVTRTTYTSLDVLLEKHIEDYWNVDEDRELSDAWTGFTRFLLLNERPPDGYTSSSVETDEETNNLSSRNLVKISPGIIARLHHTDRRLMVLLKEQCAE